MKQTLLLLYILLIPCQLYAIKGGYTPASKLAELDSVLERRDTYYMRHSMRIDSVKEVLRLNPSASALERASLHHKIFSLYSSFQGDSALSYAQREKSIVNAMPVPDPDAMATAENDLLFALISRGQWTNAVHVVENADLHRAADSLKADHYFLCNRLYTDMSNWGDGSFTDKYATISFAYCDSVTKYLPRGLYKAEYACVFKTLPGLNTGEKIVTFKRLLNSRDIDNGVKAMIASVIGDLHRLIGETDSALIYKAESAILDVKSAKHETTSKHHLAQYMFERGDLERASRYINIALEDAEYFNAPQRKSEISSVLPLIEQARYILVNRRNTTLWWVLSITIAALIALTMLAIVIVKQRDKLRRRNEAIRQQNNMLDKANHQIDSQNTELKATLDKLRESVKIKDEYIGYGFYLNSQYIAKMERLYKMINRKLAAHQYDDLRMSLKEQDLRKEKDDMRREFDRTFLNLFPAFVEHYNALFPPNEGVTPPDTLTLTPEMRIFALIRLGITDIASIATFLNYSVNTVNTYKTKAKNRSTVPNEHFEAEIMAIKSAE